MKVVQNLQKIKCDTRKSQGKCRTEDKTVNNGLQEETSSDPEGAVKECTLVKGDTIQLVFTQVHCIYLTDM